MQQIQICIHLQLVAIIFTWLNTGATRHVLKFGKYHAHGTKLQSVVENLARFLPKYILATITMVD